jgi:enoyl-CoA hydratase/carnithine racemase
MAIVEFERRDPIALITLNRPEVRNAFDAPMTQALGAMAGVAGVAAFAGKSRPA